VISTTQLLALSDDPDGFAARLARPLPSAPSSGARVGSRFHAWVEQFFRTSQLAGIGDLDSDPQLAELQRAFLASPYASARPCAVEQDFVTTLDGLPISGRIDAVFRAGDNPGLLPVGKAALIIDWKTGGERSDSRQLEVYARAWAEQAGVALESLMMGFYFVSTGRFVDTKLNP
jgi:DNA helicase-2/ATP-dependent DNA helicase PcrA